MGNYSFAGIGYAEAQDRCDEYRTGVASQGDGQILLDAPAPNARQFVSKLMAMNSGGEAAHLRLRHQGASKAASGEHLVALAAGGNRFSGKLQFRSLTPGTLVISEAGALANIVDNGSGVLHDAGIPANTRGSVNYTTGVVDLTWGGAATQPVVAAYSHKDASDFASASQSTSHTPPGGTGTGGVAYSFSLGYGRVNPGSVSFPTNGGALTFVDDGKGNIIETTANAAVAGSIDYAAGSISISTASIALTAVASAVAYTFNPFAALLAAGGSCAMLDMFGSQIPELTNEPWADGLKGESRLALWGESRSSAQTSLITKWFHAGEDALRVEAPFAGFPPWRPLKRP